MTNSEKNKKMFGPNKMLIILGFICIMLAMLIIGMNFNYAEILFLSKNANQIKESYSSTESNTWDVSKVEDGSVIATLDSNGVLTISGTGNMKDYNSPISVPWYSVRQQIKSVKIEDGVTSIGDSAFEECDSLENIVIPGNVSNIGEAAFKMCYNLTYVEMLEGVTSIEKEAFFYCEHLRNIEMSDSLISIGDYAFQYCRSLKNIEIPSRVTEIGEHPFDNCLTLTSIDVDENNLHYKDDNGVLYTKDGTYLIRYPEGRDGSEYTILSGVTNIGNYAFANCEKLSSIKIPIGVVSIGNSAFEYSNLERIEISNSVTNIGEGAFYSTWFLTNIEVDTSNAVYCDVNGVLYTKDKTTIIAYPIGRAETEYTILNSVINIEDNSFANCEKLSSIKIPNGVTTIGKEAFKDCYNLSKIEIPNSVTSIGESAFEYCGNLESIVISSNIRTIGDYAFHGCQIINIIDAEDNNIELPNIFKRTQDETDILYSSQELTLKNCAIENGKVKINENVPYASIEVEDGSLYGLKYSITYTTWDASKASDGSIIATLDDNGTLNIKGSGNMKDFTYLDVPWYVLLLQIKNVKINEGVTNIGAYAFAGGENIISIDIPNSITSIEDGAFMACYSLESIEIPSRVINIGNDVFEVCGLININVDSNNAVYSDDHGVLYNKDKTKIIRYPSGRMDAEYKILNTVQTIGEDVFMHSQLANIEIPSSVTEIENGAFSLCYNLTSIKIPNSVKNIGSNVFSGSYNITILCYEDSRAEEYAQDSNIPYQIIHLSSMQQEIDEINLFIKNIQPRLKVEELKNTLQSDISYSILDTQGNSIQDVSNIVKTGYKIKLENNKTYTIIVTGDTNGDGQADIRDILSINKHRLKKASLTTEYSLAGDVNRDGKADIRDILQINKFRLGKVQIL